MFAVCGIDQWMRQLRDSELMASAPTFAVQQVTGKSEMLIEAIQALPPIPTHLPMSEEATRAWLQQHGFDLARWVAWWDQPNEAGTVCRHFRQDKQ